MNYLGHHQVHRHDALVNDGQMEARTARNAAETPEDGRQDARTRALGRGRRRCAQPLKGEQDAASEDWNPE
ncbi:hypothetical protein MRX96_043460 [Rhipicephalus microplus]